MTLVWMISNRFSSTFSSNTFKSLLIQRKGKQLKNATYLLNSKLSPHFRNKESNFCRSSSVEKYILKNASDSS